MFNKLKFIPLIFLFVTSLFSLEIYSTVPYDYRLRISSAGDMWLYNGIIRGVVNHCQYTQVENNPYYNVRFNETSFKEKSFYSYEDPRTVGSIAYNAGLVDRGSLYKFLGYDKKPCYTGSSEICNFLKYETYKHATIPGTDSVNCVDCDTSKGEYFDSTTGLCVNKCEDITNQNDRLDCMCKRLGKIGFSSVTSSTIVNDGGDGSTADSIVCSYRCKTTKDDPEARPNGDYTEFGVSYNVLDTDPNANGVCFTDDTYAPNAFPSPNPNHPDKPDNNGTKSGGGSKPDKPDKPDINNTKPDKPNQGGGGHPGGVSNPGNNNGTKPGNPDNNNGTKPGKDGDKDNPKMDFSGYDKLTKTVSDGVKKVTDMYGDAKNQLQGAYGKIKNGSLSDFKPGGVVQSCPINKEFTIKTGLTKKISIDICAVVKDARPVLSI